MVQFKQDRIIRDFTLMPITLSDVAKEPGIVTKKFSLSNGEKITFRPLEAKDSHELAKFLTGLSSETRRLSTFDGYDLEAAKEICKAINQYDKLRFVLEIQERIIGLIEFSFGLPTDDIERFEKTGVKLSELTDCRFGPTLADDYQSRGVGGKIFPFVADVARQFGKERIILWGGVLSDNTRAIHYYEKNGFKRTGAYKDSDGSEKLDMILEVPDKLTLEGLGGDRVNLNL